MALKYSIEDMVLFAKKKNGKCLSRHYLGIKKKLTWECELTHQWEATPDCILQGSWCKECCGHKKAPFEWFKTYAKERGGTLISRKEEYDNNRSKLRYRCKKHGEFAQLVSSTRKGAWCKFCKKEENSRLHQIKQLDKAKAIALSKRGKCLSKSYKNNSTPLIWECKNEHQWKQPLDRISSGSWCKECLGPNAHGRNTLKSMAELSSEARVHNCRPCFSADSYKNGKQWLPYECLNCGNKWNAQPTKIRTGKGCYECRSNELRGQLKFPFKNLLEIAKNNSLTILTKESSYKRVIYDLKVKCDICDRSFELNGRTIRKGGGCKHCTNNLGEEICRKVLEKIFDKKFPTKRPKWLKTSLSKKPMELDGYCEEIKLAFEHQGLQHYKEISFFHGEEGKSNSFSSQIARDKAKKEICKKMGIKVLYFREAWKLKDKDNIYVKNYFLKELEKEKIPIRKGLNLELSFNLPRLGIRYDKLNRVKEQLKKMNLGINSNSYLGVTHLYPIYCLECAHRWQSDLSNIFRREGCPLCLGNRRTLTTETAKELLRKKLNVKLISEFKGAREKVLVRCSKGHELKAVFCSIEKWQSGCPKCAGTSKSLDLDDIEKVGRSKSFDILDAGNYRAKEKMLWLCRAGHIIEKTYDKMKGRESSCNVCNESPRSIEELTQFLGDYGATVNENEYHGNSYTYLFSCAKGHEFKKPLAEFKRMINAKRLKWCDQCGRT
jgi:hypothetical protein